MNPLYSLERALDTLGNLHGDLVSAQEGSMDTLLREELARLAIRAKQTAENLAYSQLNAAQSLETKKKKSADMAAANKAAIAQKKKAAAAAKAAPGATDEPSDPPIDPLLGAQLAKELLARQPKQAENATPTGVGGVLDDWQWTPQAAAPATQ